MIAATQRRGLIGMGTKINDLSEYATPSHQTTDPPFTNQPALTRTTPAYAVYPGGGVAEWPKAAVC